jgi:hypothetical protein
MSTNSAKRSSEEDQGYQAGARTKSRPRAELPIDAFEQFHDSIQLPVPAHDLATDQDQEQSQHYAQKDQRIKRCVWVYTCLAQVG